MTVLEKTAQTASFGVSKSALATYLKDVGYWPTPEDRQRYEYVLSPSAYVLSPRQSEQLERLGKKTHQAVEALNNRLVDIAAQKSPSSHEEARLVGIANSASRSLLRPLNGERKVPPIIKVDLVQDGGGNFHIVEVDTYNPRGLGYVALLDWSYRKHAVQPRYWGMHSIGLTLSNANVYGDVWYLIVSEYERFYENSFEVFRRAMALSNIEIRLVRERDLSTNRSLIPGEGANLIIIPESLNKYPDVREDLLARYHQGTLNLLFPPVAYLGSKGFLPYLREYDGMSEFIPPSALVGKKCGDPYALVNASRPLVLKANVSSGMKNVFFSDLDPEFGEMLTRASSLGKPTWILQEQVPQQPVPVAVFRNDGSTETRDFFLRITAYVSSKGIVDAEITGRPDRKVHGAPDCIMIPTVFG